MEKTLLERMREQNNPEKIRVVEGEGPDVIIDKINYDVTTGLEGFIFKSTDSVPKQNTETQYSAKQPSETYWL